MAPPPRILPHPQLTTRQKKPQRRVTAAKQIARLESRLQTIGQSFLAHFYHHPERQLCYGVAVVVTPSACRVVTSDGTAKPIEQVMPFLLRLTSQLPAASSRPAPPHNQSQRRHRASPRQVTTGRPSRSAQTPSSPSPAPAPASLSSSLPSSPPELSTTASSPLAVADVSGIDPRAIEEMELPSTASSPLSVADVSGIDPLVIEEMEQRCGRVSPCDPSAAVVVVSAGRTPKKSALASAAERARLAQAYQIFQENMMAIDLDKF